MRVLSAVCVTSLLFSAVTVSQAGLITAGGPFSDDTTSGIGILPTRTGPGINYSPSAVVVNGVTFAPGGLTGTLPTGVGYALANVPNQFGAFNPGFTGNAVNNLGNNFYFDGGTTETLTLTNLVPGQAYVLTQYDFAFGGPGGRVGNISDDQGGSLPAYDENQTPGNILQDAFVAPAGGSIVISYGPYGGDSYHQYNFQLTAVPEPATSLLLGLGVVGVVLAARRRGR